MKEFRKIKKSVRLADKVYQQLFDGIYSGVIDPNERIVQEKLADQMEVSRTPVREAMLRLENEGILQRDGKSGFVIRQIADEEAIYIYNAREAVECHALGMLCQIEDTGQADRVEELINTIDEQPKNSVIEYFEANKKIHRAFVAETKNPYLLEMFDLIWNRSSAIHLFSKISKSELPLSLKDHMALCEAVKTKDSNFAIEVMRTHIRGGLQLQLSSMSGEILPNNLNFN